MKKEKYIAHRGLHCDELWAPENSPEAFRRAVEKGFPIELDVHLTKDYQLAVFHDDTLERMTGVNVRINTLTMDELRMFRLNDTSERIPCLKEVLDTVRGSVPLYIEIKDTTHKVGRLEKILKKTMQYYKGEWTVVAFNPLRLKWFRKNSAHITRCQLVPSKNRDISLVRKIISSIVFSDFIFRNISKPDIIGYSIDTVPIKKITRAISADAKLLTWTAKAQAELNEAEKYSDFITFENFIP